jgi:SAM-dependent methyltransferase
MLASGYSIGCGIKQNRVRARSLEYTSLFSQLRKANKMAKAIRDHDKFYLKEDRKHQPKEYFKFILSNAKNHLDQYAKPRILDIGCATGDFLFYLSSLYPNASLTGIDVMSELLTRAKSEVPDCEYVQADICDEGALPNQKYEAIFMNGVHSIFDEIHPWLSNVVRLIDQTGNGKAFIFGIFNPENVDVLVKARYSNQSQDSAWQPGWNCFSKSSIQQALDKIGVKSFTFHDWSIGIDIPHHESDPLRSWTFQYLDGSRGIINGTMILHNFMLLEISA